jgi:mono/diheme cytochrome c family protein
MWSSRADCKSVYGRASLPAPAYFQESRGGHKGPPVQVFEICSRKAICAIFCLLSIAFLTGCRQDMHDQPKYKPLRPSTFFDDGRSARPQVEGTVARGQLKSDTLLYTGKLGALQATATQGLAPVSALGEAQPSAASPQGFANIFPFDVTPEVVDRGQERYNIYCSVCHDQLGTGRGMVVRRGYRQPPSFHIDRLRQAPTGYLFDVITNGFGAMPDYAHISPRDRWAIVAYLRALQLSQQGTVADVPADKREELNKPEQKQGEQKQGGHN